jgi:hypothetical protein
MSPPGARGHHGWRSDVLEFSLKGDDGINRGRGIDLSAALLTCVLVRNAARTSLALF